MTLFYWGLIHLYIGWEELLPSRKLHICCTRECLKVFWGCFELVWDWIDIFPHSHGSTSP